MKISVVTVCYNAVKSIRNTIESVLNQDYDDIDYIIIDGGSTDGTVEIIKEYSEKISYWCSEKDEGIYDAMNKGLSKAKGDIIAFLNSDDRYTENIFHDVADCFTMNDADAVYGDFHRCYDDIIIDTCVLNKINLDDLFYKWIFCHQAMFVKTDIFKRIGFYNTEYRVSADYDWVLRAYVDGAKFVYLPKAICYFEVGGYSMIAGQLSAKECRDLKLKILPEDKKEMYLDKIYEVYNKRNDDIWLNVFDIVMLGNESIINKVTVMLKAYNKKIILFGAGVNSIRFLTFLKKFNIDVLAIFDNNQKRWETYLDGYKVKQPYFINDSDIKILITPENFGKEIKNQLLDLGYQSGNIITSNELNEYLEAELGAFI